MNDEVELTWPDSPDGVVGKVQRIAKRLVGPVAELAVDHPAVARLASGDLVYVTASGAAKVQGRVLHVETCWRTFGSDVVRTPTLLTMTTGPELIHAMRPRRFVRVQCNLQVEIRIGDVTRPGRCTMLAPRGMRAVVEGSLPSGGEAHARISLPTGLVDVVGWVMRQDPTTDGTGVELSLNFTPDHGIDRRISDFVLCHGYTPVPATLAS